ncbi:hypothetical protein GCM10022262_11160 [Georgenia daeguensis]|uniref:Capsule synthesis protein CapA domain-containing protein n=1 Tax=Georgenia daeguensis TaxID=908355 RepID=A0ABP8ERY4_9MICO
MLASALTGVALASAVAGLGAGARPLPDGGPDAPPAATPAPVLTPTPAPTPGPAPSSTPTPAPDVTFTILSAGDVLPHASVNRSAALPGGGYDFVPLMAGVEEWTAGADLALCSLEVPLAPPGEEVSAYPAFGAPGELVTALAELGWDGCATATNHALDRGLAGVSHTLDMLDAAGLGHVGTARDAGEAAQPQLYVLRRGEREIVVAHLAATTLLNGPAAPAAAPWAVTRADAGALTEQARAAREAGADVVVASLHWGVEYVHSPTREQLEIAAALADGGQIDVVLGNHSHVPQPIEQLPGGPDGAGMWVAWSMGNFLSNQDDECCTMETATGVMTTTTVEVPADGPARVTGLGWAPVTVDRDGEHRIYPLLDLAAGAGPSGLRLDDATIASRAARVTEVMGADRVRREAADPTGPEPEVVPRGLRAVSGP